MPDPHLTKKLLIKPTHTVRLFNAPPGYADLITAPEQSTAEPADFVLLFVHSRAELAAHAVPAIESLRPTGALWIAYPKKTAIIKSDLNRDIDWSEIRSHDFEHVSLIAIDDTWSAFRFRKTSESNPPRRRSTPSPPRGERPELIVPNDLSALLGESPTAKATFDRFSYSHRKEYIEWIEGAKRPETRTRRLQKAIEMMNEGKPLS